MRLKVEHIKTSLRRRGGLARSGACRNARVETGWKAGSRKIRRSIHSGFLSMSRQSEAPEVQPSQSSSVAGGAKQRAHVGLHKSLRMYA